MRNTISSASKKLHIIIGDIALIGLIAVLAGNINSEYRTVPAIRKQIVSWEAGVVIEDGIVIQVSSDAGIVVTALQVVEPGFYGIAVAVVVFTEILYHISGSVARRKLASARQILQVGFRHSADFPGGCFNPYHPTVSPSRAKIRAEHRCPARMGRDNLFCGLLLK